MKLFGVNVELQRIDDGITSLVRFSDIQKRMMKGASRWITLPVEWMRSRAYQVRPVDDGWMIAERGSSVPLVVFNKKTEALRAAKKMAQEKKAALDIYTRTGSLQATLSFA